MKKNHHLPVILAAGLVVLLIGLAIGQIRRPKPSPLPTGLQVGIDASNVPLDLKHVDLTLVLDSSGTMSGYFGNTKAYGSMAKFWKGLEALSHKFKSRKIENLEGQPKKMIDRDFQAVFLPGNGVFSETTSPIDKAFDRMIKRMELNEKSTDVSILISDAQISYFDHPDKSKDKSSSQIQTAEMLKNWVRKGQNGFVLLALRTPFKGTYESQKRTVKSFQIARETDRLLYCFILGSDHRAVEAVGDELRRQLKEIETRCAYLETGYDFSDRVEFRLTGSNKPQPPGDPKTRNWDDLFNLKLFDRLKPTKNFPAWTFRFKATGQGTETLVFKMEKVRSMDQKAGEGDPNPWRFPPKSFGSPPETIDASWFTCQVDRALPAASKDGGFEWRPQTPEEGGILHRKLFSAGMDLVLLIDADIRPSGQPSDFYRVRVNWNPARMHEAGPLKWIHEWNIEYDDDYRELTRGGLVRTLDIEDLFGEALALKDPSRAPFKFATFYISIKH